MGIPRAPPKGVCRLGDDLREARPWVAFMLASEAGGDMTRGSMGVGVVTPLMAARGVASGWAYGRAIGLASDVTELHRTDGISRVRHTP